MFLVDGSEPAGKGDKWIAQNLLQTETPVIIVMNKVDKLKKLNRVEENLLTYKLLFEKNYPVVKISAKQAEIQILSLKISTNIFRKVNFCIPKMLLQKKQ